MVPLLTFLVFIAFVAFIVFKAFCVIGAYLTVISLNSCELESELSLDGVNPRLSPLRQIPVHPGTHLHSEDLEHPAADGT